MFEQALAHATRDSDTQPQERRQVVDAMEIIAISSDFRKNGHKRLRDCFNFTYRIKICYIFFFERIAILTHI